MLINEKHLAVINSPKQTIKARVELYNGSTLENTCSCDDVLSEFVVERTGEGKFFGFGICQKLKASLADIKREMNITKDHALKAAFIVENDALYPFPKFYAQEIERDETSNMLNITAYDILYKAEAHKFEEVEILPPYTLLELTSAVANVLGLSIKLNQPYFSLEFSERANFDGTESLRQVLNAIAEATQTIYYIDNNGYLVFKRLSRDTSNLIELSKNHYFELTSSGIKTISNIAHITDLGDNVSTEVGDSSGITQFVRNNPLWELRNDIDVLLADALNNVAGLSIAQFEALWCGNYLLEIGDRFGIIGEDNAVISTFLLDDTITFDGTLIQQSRWQYDENEGETHTNPISLGEKLNEIYAKVDKVNKKIEIVAKQADDNKYDISQLNIDTNGINASVLSMEKSINDSIDSINNTIEMLSKSVEAKMTDEQVSIAIKEELSNGVSKVETTTGFVFDEQGLTISKSGQEMTTQITEDGITVYRDNDAVLTANNTGVNAENLHATTYLIIGGRSRFENYGTNRTGCYWIGGNN